jgi:hypothetical protein
MTPEEFKAVVGAIRPAGVVVACESDFALFDNIVEARLAGATDAFLMQVLAGRVDAVTRAIPHIRKEIRKVKAEIKAGRHAPNRDSYINAWRLDADLVIAGAFLQTAVALMRVSK